MTCPECFYEKWDGNSCHLFGGRASAKLTCFGPKRRTIVESKKLDDALPKARKDMEAVSAKAKPERRTKPDVPAAEETKPVQPSKAEIRSAKMNAAIDALESGGLPVQRGSALLKPKAANRTPTSEPASSGRSARKTRRVRKGKPVRSK